MEMHNLHNKLQKEKMKNLKEKGISKSSKATTTHKRNYSIQSNKNQKSYTRRNKA